MINEITVITPCYNAKSMIEDTIESVLSQSAFKSGSLKLQYIIVDGGSNDGTLDIIKGYSEKNPSVQFISENDRGMYDALVKGLKLATGDIVCYLNAGDLYYTHAFKVVQSVFIDNSHVSWITGMRFGYNEASEVINVIKPFRYLKTFIRRGLYDGKRLPFIQQESTFWRRELLEEIDYLRLLNFKYAGDSFLWYSFSKKQKLYIVNSFLGGFKFHENQLSENYKDYQIECHNIYGKPRFSLYYMEKICWHLPTKIRDYFSSNYVIKYDFSRKSWLSN